MYTIDMSPNITRNKLIEDAKKVNASKFLVKKQEPKEISEKEIKLKSLYEKFREALANGNADLIQTAKVNLITFKATI